MPQAQFYNIQPRTEQTNLEKIVSGASQRYQENKENDELSSIYRQYQQDGQNIQTALEAARTRPGISPSKRAEAVSDLLAMEKINTERMKVQAKQQKEQKQLQDRQAENERGRQALKDAGATPQQLALYEAAPIGGKTKIVEDVIETSQRNKAPIGFVPEDVNDYDQGLTPKERVKRQDQRFTTQTPLVTANSNSINGLEQEGLSIDLLQELTDSGKVGQGLHNLNINPKTGDLFIPKGGTPEEQLFVKTVNDFTVKAKDSFGARVTNFELDRFMQRLPTLANSEEGRRLILRQMKIINQINQLEKKAVRDVFDQYGVRNIDYVEAENIARKKINEQKEVLRKEYLDFEQLSRKQEEEILKNIRKNIPSGYIPMRKPDGTIKGYPEKNRSNLEDKGYIAL